MGNSVQASFQHALNRVLGGKDVTFHNLVRQNRLTKLFYQK